MRILGISGFYHDSAAALIIDGKVIAAAQEERFTRKKHDASFPGNACKYCLEYGGIKIKDLDAIAFYDKPLLKFERLLETYYAFAPKGLISFLSAIPVWIKEKLFLRKTIIDELLKLESFDKRKVKILFPEHHLSHAASSFYPSGFKDAAIVTIDGVGEWSTASIGHGKGKNIEVLKDLNFPHSVGLFYSAFTYWLGFRVNSGEYKFMGLAPYGNPDSEQIVKYDQLIRKELVDIKEDGSIRLNQDYFTYATRLKMVDTKKWEKLFGFPRRDPETGLEQHHCNLAYSVQKITEEIVLNIAREAKQLTGSKKLCLAGGVALNCVANGKLIKEGIFEDVFIQPAAGDAGGAIGAALASHHIYFQQEGLAENLSNREVYYGPEYSHLDIEQTSRKFRAKYHKIESTLDLCKEAASLIASDNVIGWFQNRMEFGPRALGNRSILADPRNSKMQKKLNLKIKYRESFRPFAPSVLEEDCKEYFDLDSPSPYMLLTAPVKKDRCLNLPENYNELDLKERLYFLRSDIPAVTHIDFSARIQTVNKNENPLYWQLIKEFKNLTGYGLLVNTSFNVRGEPIVCTPEDAYRCFMRTEMDVLILGHYIFYKREQAHWDHNEKWKEEFLLD